jgi:hypothetical protein
VRCKDLFKVALRLESSRCCVWMVSSLLTVRSDCRQNKHSPALLLGQPDKPPHAISVYLYLTVAGYKMSCALPESASQKALSLNTNVLLEGTKDSPEVDIT